MESITFVQVTVIQPTEDFPTPRLVGLDTDGKVWVTKDIAPFTKWYPISREY